MQIELSEKQVDELMIILSYSQNETWQYLHQFKIKPNPDKLSLIKFYEERYKIIQEIRLLISRREKE